MFQKTKSQNLCFTVSSRTPWRRLEKCGKSVGNIQPEFLWGRQRLGTAAKQWLCEQPPLLSCFSKRLRALSLVLVIPFLNYFSQVIVSSCCTEIFSHRVTVTLVSQTKAAPVAYRKHITKLVWPQVSRGRRATQQMRW